ncbi:ferrous iron transporter B [bacterium]|nr:ferrous iron transporter B [bacterium]
MNEQVLIVGSPNAGKSLLFNRLTGLNQKVANFPGVTVEIHSGASRLYPQIEYVDFPGVYSMNALTGDERVAVKALTEALENKDVRLVICVLDATRLERSLIYGLQVLKLATAKNNKVIFAANMLDELKANNMQVDIQGLSHELGVPVILLSARTQEGLSQLEDLVSSPVVSKNIPQSLMETADHDMTFVAHDLARKYGPKGDVLLKTQYRFDRFLLSSGFGFLAFFSIMYFLFQSIFSWAAPLMDGLDSGLKIMSAFVVSHMPPGFWADFVRDALFGGIGAFIVFVPQIFVLSFIVGFLEDSGYLARAAVLCHRPLKYFGLTGKSFVPMLSGFACAIPGLYAARTIDSPRRRFLTYMAIPLMACSARLPVYGLLIATLIPAKTLLGGILGLQGLVFFCLYLFGIVVALLVTGILSRTGYKATDDTPFILEMPPYRLPMWRVLVRHSWEKARAFLMRAGGIIFTVTVVVWFLGYMPNHGTDLSQSYMATIGHYFEPLVKPLGLDWMYAVAILTSFLAREVFVGTMGALLGIESADSNMGSLADKLASTGLTLPSGLALLAFYAVALQCVATLATLKRESGSWKLPAFAFILYFVLAYIVAFVVYRLAL